MSSSCCPKRIRDWIRQFLIRFSFNSFSTNIDTKTNNTTINDDKNPFTTNNNAYTNTNNTNANNSNINRNNNPFTTTINNTKNTNTRRSQTESMASSSMASSLPESTSSVDSEVDQDEWKITEEQREYYTNQFANLQPNLEDVIKGSKLFLFIFGDNLKKYFVLCSSIDPSFLE